MTRIASSIRHRSISCDCPISFARTGLPVRRQGHDHGDGFPRENDDLQKPATRIVCLIESALSGLYMLGAEQQVVGVSANIYNGSVFAWYAALDGQDQHKRSARPRQLGFRQRRKRHRPQAGYGDHLVQPDRVDCRTGGTGDPVFGVFLTSKEDVYREMLALGASPAGRSGPGNWWHTAQGNRRFLPNVPHRHRNGVRVSITCGPRGIWRPPAAAARSTT